MNEEVYNNWYKWTDPDVLRDFLSDCNPSFIVEAATGPNIAVPYSMNEVKLVSDYVSIDLKKKHIMLQKEGLKNGNTQGVIGDAAHLPLKDECVDMFIFHHAIDDILETKDFKGLWTSIDEALRTLKIEGCMILSHCVFSYDHYTKEIKLSDVQDFIERKTKCIFQKVSGARQNWLLVKNIIKQ